MTPCTRYTIIAGVGALMHFALTLVSIYGSILLRRDRMSGEYENNALMLHIIEVCQVLLIVSSVVEFMVLVSSICLIVGIQKERSLFVVAWLYVSAGYMILSVIDGLCGFFALGHWFSIKAIVFLFHLSTWYPILMHWRYLRKVFSSNFIG